MDQAGSSSLKYFENYLANCDDPGNAWDSKFARRALTDESVLWVLDLANWNRFITLTFEKFEVADDKAVRLFYALVKYLNKELFGKHYTKIVKHSYFSYVLAMEYQVRGVVHFHVLVDRPVDYDKIHAFWNKWAGFASIKPIRSQIDCVRYVTKYNLKGGQIYHHKSKKLYIPKVIPHWWNEDQDNKPNLIEDCPGVLSGRETRRHTGRN